MDEPDPAHQRRFELANRAAAATPLVICAALALWFLWNL
jgi:hypothetical protein